MGAGFRVGARSVQCGGTACGSGAAAGTVGADGTFMRGSRKNASTAAVRSKTMAMVNTPAQPVLGSAILTWKGIQVGGTTVRKMPIPTMISPMLKSVSCVALERRMRSTVGEMKWAYTA